MKPLKPSDLEMQVLTVLWANGPSTVRDALKLLPDGKERAYTTILSVMQVMERKGLLTHRKQGTAHLFKPTATRDQVLTPYLERMVKNIFNGSTYEAVAALIDKNTNKADIKAIRELLDKKK